MRVIRRIGIFGGTFNPPHLGHVRIAEAVKNSGIIDELLIVPAANPPHKSGQMILPSTYRLAMAELAFKDIAVISTCELDRKGFSYTVDTLIAVKELYEKQNISPELYLVMGADSLVDFHNWYKAEEILSLARLLVINRPGIIDARTASALEFLQNEWNAEVNFLTCLPTDISSTEIRQQLTDILAEERTVPQGRQANITPQLVDVKLPPAVLQFILQNGIYAYRGLFNNLAWQVYEKCNQIEVYLREKLSRARVIHSLNVFCLAIYFAQFYDVDVNDVAIAAILHDSAKEMTKEEILSYLPELANTGNYHFALWHSDVGAVIAKKLFAINNENILHAIKVHSTLCANAGNLDKLLFVADKIEPGRKYTDLQPIREAFSHDLDLATQITARTVAEIYIKQGNSLTKDLLAYLDEISGN